MLSSEAGKLGCGCALWGSTVATEGEEDDGFGAVLSSWGSTPKEGDVESSWDPSAHSDLVCKTTYLSKCSYIWKVVPDTSFGVETRSD